MILFLDMYVKQNSTTPSLFDHGMSPSTKA